MAEFLKRTALRLFCCAAISVFAGGVAAETYYVSTTGSNTKVGSINRPFTLTKANRVARPGDLVLIRGGVYRSPVALSTRGTRGNRIIYQSYPGEIAVFDGSLARDGLRATWFTVSASWIVVRNIVVRNSPGHGVYVFIGATNNVFDRIVTHHNYIDGLRIENGSRNLLRNITAYANQSSQNFGGNSDGISILSGTGNIIKNCHTFNNSDDGVDVFKSSNTTIQHCISHNNGFRRGDGNGFKLGSREAGAFGGHLLTRNIAYENLHSGFDYNGATIRIRLFNNTAFNNPINFHFAEAAHVLRNNIAFPRGLVLGLLVDDQFNSWNLGIPNPLFANPATSELAPISLAIDVGIDVGLPYAGAAPDLGAREFSP
jgi:parallel beta-helix repeat protein